MQFTTDIEQLRYDLVLFANDLSEYHRLPEGQAVIRAFYASAWGDYDLPESQYYADELGGLPSIERAILQQRLGAYWDARNGGEE